jgi:hypothetical protein
MGSNSFVPVNAGGVTQVDSFLTAGGDHQQVIREVRSTALTNDSWTVTTTGLSAKVAADSNRVGLVIVSAASGRVYFRFDATIPVIATPAYHWFLDPSDRYEVPLAFTQLAISMVGAVAGGTILLALATAS